jgi:signal transduction histidine kinase
MAAPVRFVGGILVALLAALALFYVLMRPPFGDLRAMALFLTVTAALSLMIGYAAHRGGWLSRSPRLSWSLLGIYALSSILTFLNVWITARLMFASSHDLMLATILLWFAGLIAMALGYFLSTEVTGRIRVLSGAAEAIAAGRLGTRVPVSGRDEMAGLARSFNEMAAQLEAGAEKQRELDTLRRDLIAWAGHDLRTPLASVRAIVEALADGVVEDAETQERYLRTAQREIRSLSRLIDDLFELAQLDAGGLRLERQPNSISDLISDAIESFSAMAQAQGVALSGSAQSGVDPVFMDGEKIGRVLNNLVGNALRHTPAGGTVELRAWREGQEVRVSVHNTGADISAEDLPRVFERFYRGEKSRSRASGGAGLGLAIALGIVEAHAGRIWAESPPDQGATFTFSLPG